MIMSCGTTGIDPCTTTSAFSTKNIILIYEDCTLQPAYSFIFTLYLYVNLFLYQLRIILWT